MPKVCFPFASVSSPSPCPSLATVPRFNGCGYCKWARSNTNPKLNGYQNPGWPGCCRAPNQSELKSISPADWPVISTAHKIPIPSDVKALLESIGTASSRTPAPATSPPAGKASPTTPPSLDRKGSAGLVPTRASGSSPRSQPLSIPSKVRSNGSPKENSAPLGVPSPRGPGLEESPPSVTDQVLAHHRKSNMEHVDKRGDSPNSPSPLRRHMELEATMASRSSDRRPSVSTIKLASKAADPPSLRRRASTADTSAMANNAATASARTMDRRGTISASRPSEKRSSLDIDFGAISIASSPKSPSSGSSDGGDARSVGGSSSEGTITSDGGFTDYLSDESEAELQKQAEARARLLAQNQMEEQEFKMARKQLAHVDLRPPKSWNLGTPQATPRSQIAATQPYPSMSATTYGPPRGQVEAVGYTRAR
ncbi:hypothetical protein OF83DRAFT_1080671 [Amylostereum chailletii]|nr:hypothetical protein OF83DRAFT_1080671 [Amylostereum chailletii]